MSRAKQTVRPYPKVAATWAVRCPPTPHGVPVFLRWSQSDLWVFSHHVKFFFSSDIIPYQFDPICTSRNGTLKFAISSPNSPRVSRPKEKLTFWNEQEQHIEKSQNKFCLLCVMKMIESLSCETNFGALCEVAVNELGLSRSCWDPPSDVFHQHQKKKHGEKCFFELVVPYFLILFSMVFLVKMEFRHWIVMPSSLIRIIVVKPIG